MTIYRLQKRKKSDINKPLRLLAVIVSLIVPVLLIAKQQDILKGILLMIVYSIGLGIPFILSVTLIEKLKEMFNFIKNNYGIIKKISGTVLIIMGIYTIFI